MFKIASFTAPLLLVLLILVPLYLINSNNLLFITKVLPAHACINNGYFHQKLCITCTTLSNSEMLTDSNTIIQNNLNDFRLINIPYQGILQCQQIIQMIDYSDLDKINSVRDLHYEDISQMTQIVNILHMTTSQSNEKQAKISGNVKMVGLLELVDRNAQPTQTKLQFISKQCEVLLVKYFKICAVLSVVLLLGYLAITLSQKKEVWYRLIICLSILIMVGVSCADGQLSQIHDFNTLQLAKCLFIGLIFMKIKAKKLLVALIMITFFFIPVSFSFYFFIFSFFLFLLVLFSKKQATQQESDSVYLGTVLLLLCLSTWMKSQVKIEFVALSLIIELNLLIFGTLLSEASQKSQNATPYEQLPGSGLSLPGFEQTVNDDDEQQD